MGGRIIDEYDRNKFIEVKDEFIFAKGGDGTLLKAIHKFMYLDKPFFGVGAGTVNFLMNENDKISDNSKYKKLTLIKVKIKFVRYDIRGNERIKTIEHQAFNDVVIGGDISDWIDFEVHDKNRIIGKFQGGGLIFSTAQGSTGINKNNGGVILPLNSKNWSVTGDKTNHKINYVLSPDKCRVLVNSRTPVSVWIDGKNKIIKNVKEIELSKGSNVTVIFNKYKEFKRKRRS